jgi:hypothetical protein
MKSIGYGTPATSLLYQDCDDTQKPFISSILPKNGNQKESGESSSVWDSATGGLELTTLQQSRIWSHLHLYDAQIQINGLWTPQPGREGDILIIEGITATGIFTTREL